VVREEMMPSSVRNLRILFPGGWGTGLGLSLGLCNDTRYPIRHYYATMHTSILLIYIEKEDPSIDSATVYMIRAGCSRRHKGDVWNGPMTLSQHLDVTYAVSRLC
jgi:hypothetical protein